jgi:hypothetical protein
VGDDIAVLITAIERTGCDAAQARMSELERDMQPLAEEIIAAPATSLSGLRAKALDNRRRRKGEILCHNHVLHTAATANGVHCFHWFTVCAPAGWDPASEEWEVCPCGWRPELRKHYAKADHVQWWREQIKERGSLEAVYREVRRRQREYGDRDVG